MTKTVCYTCITGNYDNLKHPYIISQNIDYICFTDNMQIQGGIWKLIPIPNELKYLNNVKKQRIIKICPHRYLKDYNISIWVDGNIQIKNDLNKFVAQYDLNENFLYTRIHPFRNCIYDEAEACVKMNKDTNFNIQQQIQKYKDDGYPAHIGMVETGILLRKHNNIKCQLLCNNWATELLKYSHRDQLSFNYVCWKNKYICGIMKNEFKLNSDCNMYFEWSRHHGQ